MNERRKVCWGKGAGGGMEIKISKNSFVYIKIFNSIFNIKVRVIKLTACWR